MGLQRKSSTSHVVIGGELRQKCCKCPPRWAWCLGEWGTTPTLAGVSGFLLKSKQAPESSPGFLTSISKLEGFSSSPSKPVLVVHLPFAGCAHPVCGVLSVFTFFPRKGSTKPYHPVHPRAAVCLLFPPACLLRHLDARRRSDPFNPTRARLLQCLTFLFPPSLYSSVFDVAVFDLEKLKQPLLLCALQAPLPLLF